MKKGSMEIRIGCCLTGAIILLALISLFYTPYDINYMDIRMRMAPPSFQHLFGTDNMGRDVFSRAITGARFTLLVAVSTVAGCTLITSVLGLASGYVGGLVDEVIMRIIDAINSFPGILIALIIVTVMQHGSYTIILALCIMFIPSFTRIVRTGTLQLLLSSVIVGLSNAILAEASMSYLGLGIQPPAPSWGRMLYEAQSIIFSAPWCALAPGLMIVVTIVGFNCIGEGLRKKYL